jgi:hypothetical protein
MPNCVQVKRKQTMPKPAKDLRLHGVKFEDALKRILSAPPMPKKPKAKNPARLPKHAQN